MVLVCFLDTFAWFAKLTQEQNYVSHQLMLKLSFQCWCVLQHHSPISKLGNVTKVFFGIRSQIVPFWVLPCKHFFNSVSLLNSRIYLQLLVEHFKYNDDSPCFFHKELMNYSQIGHNSKDTTNYIYINNTIPWNSFFAFGWFLSYTFHFRWRYLSSVPTRR